MKLLAALGMGILISMQIVMGGLIGNVYDDDSSWVTIPVFSTILSIAIAVYIIKDGD